MSPYYYETASKSRIRVLISQLFRFIDYIMAARINVSRSVVGDSCHRNFGRCNFRNRPNNNTRASMTRTSRLLSSECFLFSVFLSTVTIIGWNATDELIAPLHSWLRRMSVVVWVGFLRFSGPQLYSGVPRALVARMYE